MTKIYRRSKKLRNFNLFWYIVFTVFTAGIGLIFTLPLTILEFLLYSKNALEVTDKSVIYKRGLISTNEIEIPFTKINSILVKQGIIAKSLDAGNIAILTGNDITGEVFRGVENPQEVKKYIMSLVDKKY
jgi:uncharacterized membrane protein YdbT with pleckstrin-like domain